MIFFNEGFPKPCRYPAILYLQCCNLIFHVLHFRVIRMKNNFVTEHASHSLAVTRFWINASEPVVSVDIEDREGMVRMCPREPNCPRDGANTSHSRVTLIWSPASLISPTQHHTNKANASIYCLNLPSCSEVHWGSEIPTSESKQRTLPRAKPDMLHSEQCWLSAGHWFSFYRLLFLSAAEQLRLAEPSSGN